MNSRQHKVERAVIMAAGTGKRLQPLTLQLPKPLIPVHGVRMIDTIIQGLHQNGIYEIFVVVGYLKEQFEFLPSLYPGVQLIINPYFDTCNNISSLYVARAHLQNCIILDGDQCVYNPDILSPYFDRSGYNAVWIDHPTVEWLLDVKGGIVRSCSRTGGSHGWQLYSVSRWTQPDGKKLSTLVEQEFMLGNKDLYWDDIPMFSHFDQFQLGIRQMREGDIVEIDSLEELATIDPSYDYIMSNTESKPKNRRGAYEHKTS